MIPLFNFFFSEEFRSVLGEVNISCINYTESYIKLSDSFAHFTKSNNELKSLMDQGYNTNDPIVINARNKVIENKNIFDFHNKKSLNETANMGNSFQNFDSLCKESGINSPTLNEMNKKGLA